MEDMSVKHLLKVDGFGAGTCDDESYVGMGGQYARYRGDEQIGAFVVE